MTRRDFLYQGKGYLDNAATTQELCVSADASIEWIKQGRANTGRGIYSLAERADHELERARRDVASFLGGDRGSVLFLQGATHAANFLALQFAKESILISQMEHHGNIIPWQMYAKDLSWVKITPKGEFDYNSLQKELDKSPNLLSLVHVSNVLGGENDLGKIAEMASASGVPLAIDGSQATAKIKMDLDNSGIDFYFFSGHKCYGPDGVGVLWISERMIDRMKPVFGGGGMVGKVTEDGYDLLSGVSRLQPGTLPLEQIIGLHAALEWINERRGFLLDHELSLAEPAREVISKYGKILGEREGVGPISFNIDGVHPHDVAQIAANNGLALRAGKHCAGPLHQALGEIGSARISFAAYNDSSDIDLLEKVLYTTVKTFS